MSVPENSRPLHVLLAPLCSVLLWAAVGPPAPAQQVLVQNGATAQVSNSGVWHLQGATMDFGPAGATARLEETAKGRVTGGLLTAARTLISPNAVDVAGLGAVLSASANLGEVTVTRGHAVQTASNGNESIERYYDLSATGTNSGLSATLTVTYNDAELNNLAESGLELFKRTSGTWEEKGVDSRDAPANTVTLSGIASFSRWTLGSKSAPLPVEMAGFDGTRTEEGVQLTWQTASETGNAGFAVQRTAGGAGQGIQTWKKVAFVDGAGTTTAPQRYRFTDEKVPFSADTLAYRLRQVDTDGSATVTDPVVVARDEVKRLQLRNTFPNPAQNRVTVQFAIPEGTDATDVKMRLYDVMGRQVRTVAQEAEAGRHQRQLRVQDLASGVYLLRLRGGGETRTQRLTIVR